MYPDFEELLESLNAKKVRYLIGGAHALALHARPRTRVDANFGAVPAQYLGREQLIAEKRHFDRPQDRADVAVLLEGRGPRRTRKKKARTRSKKRRRGGGARRAPAR